MQSDLEGKVQAAQRFARRRRFAAPCQMVVARDIPHAGKVRSTVHGVVFDFFAIRASVMEPYGG
jgi:hypothetical protein